MLGYAGLAVVDPDESWVQNIAVRRDAQRSGLGRALLEALLAEAARRGVRKTLLEVAVDNAAGPEAVRRPTISSRSASAAATTNPATPTLW